MSPSTAAAGETFSATYDIAGRQLAVKHSDEAGTSTTYSAFNPGAFSMAVMDVPG